MFPIGKDWKDRSLSSEDYERFELFFHIAFERI